MKATDIPLIINGQMTFCSTLRNNELASDINLQRVIRVLRYWIYGMFRVEMFCPSNIHFN
jgi:hypothetical protein